MESEQSERRTKLPPTPSYTSIQRKSFVKISSNNNIPETTKKIENNDSIPNNGPTVRKVPILHSISTTSDTGTGQDKNNFVLDRLDSFSMVDLQSALPSRLIHNNKSLFDRCSSSSGYDSNSNSSLSYYTLPNSSAQIGGRTTPRMRSHFGHSLTDFNHSLMNRQDSFNQTKRRSRSSEKSFKEKLIQTLDRLEKRIAFFKEIASELCLERDKLVDALAQVNVCCSTPTSLLSEVDMQDIRVTSDYLQRRLNSVHITIASNRTLSQSEAFKKANEYIAELAEVLQKRGKMIAKQRCLSYISCCSSDNLIDNENQQVAVPIDEKFQKTVIQCALEDQKIIKQKLQSVLRSIDQ